MELKLLLILIFSLVMSSVIYDAWVLSLEKQSWPSFRKKSPGLSLLLELQKINRFSVQSEKNSQLPPYKKFHVIAEKLVTYFNTHGVDIFDELLELQDGLRDDLRFSKRFNKKKRQGVIEVLLISFLAWLLGGSAFVVLELQLQWLQLFVALTLQVFGIGFFIFFSNMTEKRIFHPIDLAVDKCLTLNFLSSSGGAVNEFFEELKVFELESFTRTHGLFKQLNAILIELSHHGEVTSKQTKSLLRVSWSLREEGYLEYEEKLIRLKAAVTLLFAVPSYFLIVGSVFMDGGLL